MYARPVSHSLGRWAGYKAHVIAQNLYQSLKNLVALLLYTLFNTVNLYKMSKKAPPKKPSKVKAPGKKKKGKTTAEERASSPSDDEPLHQAVEANPSPDKESGEKEDEFSEKQMEVMAGFFEDRPYFYDLGHEHYKSKHKKQAALKDLGEQMGIERKWLSYC